MLEFLIVDVVIIVVVEVAEYGAQSFFGLEISDFRSHQFYKLIKRDGFTFGFEVLDDFVDEGAFAAVAQLLHYFVDFFRVNGARVVLVEQIEGGSQLFVLLGMQSLLPGECLSFGWWEGGFVGGDLRLGSSTHILNG